jgi:hypothetical protein
MMAFDTRTSRRTPRPAGRLARALAGAALLALLCGGCQTTARSTRPMNSDDYDRGVTLPRTMANVWYRTDDLPVVGFPYQASGTLLVGTDAILFNSDEGSVNIPTRAIRSVVWRTMSGDRLNEWAVVKWVENGGEKLVGFTAADGYRFDTSNKELYSAIVMAWNAQGGG